MIFALPFLSSCDGNLPISIEIGEKSFDIPLVLDQPAPENSSLQKVKTENLTSFSDSITYNLQDSMFAALQEHVDANEEIEFAANNIRLLLSPIEDIEFQVYNFKTEAIVDGEVKYFYEEKDSNIVINEEFENEELTAFINNVFLDIQEGNNVTITVSGEIDKDSDTFSSQQIATIKFLFNLGAKVQVSSGVSL